MKTKTAAKKYAQHIGEDYSHLTEAAKPAEVSIVNLDDGMVSIMRGPLSAHMVKASTVMAAGDLLAAAKIALEVLDNAEEAPGRLKATDALRAACDKAEGR